MAKLQHLSAELERIDRQFSEICMDHDFGPGRKDAKENILRSKLLIIRSDLMDLQVSIPLLPDLPPYKKNQPAMEEARSLRRWCVETRRIIDLRQIIHQEPDSQKVDKLKPCVEKAYRSYEYVISQNPKLKTDRNVYDWLKEEWPDNEEPLQEFKTWQRYLREARNHYGTQKDVRPLSRPSNIKPVESIESLSMITTRFDNE